MQKVIERILNLLAFLLTAGRPVTADEIRHTVKGYDQEGDEAFRRTFERDKDLLRSLGVPMSMSHTDIWEVELGYVVAADEYAIDDPGFTDEERSALLLAAQAVRFGGEATGASAIFKLGGASGAPGSSVTADLGHRLDTLGNLFQAVVDKQRLQFMYGDHVRTVDPYSLGHRFGHWYLLAPEKGSPTHVKAFRVDRMGDHRLVGDTSAFERPSRFRAQEFLPESIPTNGRAELIAKVRFDRGVAPVALAQSRGAKEVSADATTVTLEIGVSSTDAFISWMIGFDDRAVIIDPPELVASFLAHVGVHR